MPKFEEYNPEETKPKEEKEPANIIEYFEQDLRGKEKSIEWLETEKKKLEDIIKENKDLTKGILDFFEEEIKEFEIEIRVNKSMMELTKQRLAEKRAEADKNNT